MRAKLEVRQQSSQIEQDNPGPGFQHFSLPAGITVEGATSPQGGKRVSFSLSPFSLPRAAPAAKKGGALPPPSPPLVRRAGAPCEAGTTRGGAALRFTPEEAGNPCQPTSNADFQE